jgi:CheY-like chemotaxis protein
MDIQMPEVDGITATKMIRSHPHLANLPVIAMTAHALVEERERCFAAGMNAHVAKPIDPDDLFSTLTRWATPKPRAAAEPRSETAKPSDPVPIPEIAGVNITDGVNRVAGNRRLYRDLLSQFATKQAGAAAEIALALDQGDRQTAERVAHTVKGVAGNLGISGVQAAAQKLEKSIRESQDSVPALLDQFAATLRLQTTAIAKALESSTFEPPPAAPAQPFNEENAAVAIDRLRSLLAASDGDAQDAFQHLQTAVSEVVDQRHFDSLSESINNFEFDAAIATLDEIARICEHHEAQTT